MKYETKTLVSDRLILRKFTMEDSEQVFNNYATDPKTTRFLTWKPHENIEVTKSVISKWLEEYNKEISKPNWIVTLKDTNEVIGAITVVKESFNSRNCEIGYCYGSKYWNNGYGTEALKTVMKYLFEECNMHLIIAIHEDINIGSGKVMEKAGMKKETVLKDRIFDEVTQEFQDYIVYSLTENEYKSIK